jgi:DNA mismatch repair protein MutS2
VDKEALSILGYDEITRRLVGSARMPKAKEILGQPFFPGLAELELLLDETAAGLVFGRSFGWPDFSEHDIGALLGRIHPLDSMLAPHELLTIAHWIERTGSLTHYRKQAAICGAGAAPLDPYFDGIIPQTPLAKAIYKTIDDQGRVQDSASAELAKTRREMRDLAERAVRILQKLFAEPRYDEILQERIISLRDGRHVVPVKANFVGRMRGIILDRSASGGTLFMEPDAVIPIDNSIKELELHEERLITKILLDLTARVREAIPNLQRTLDNAATLDCIFARARLADAHDAVRPEFGHTLDIYIHDARHPLLKQKVVPIDIVLKSGARALIITGPNTGGKTVALKTLGLFTLMAQSGLFIPAANGSRLRHFSGVFCDIGDEQSIEKNLSTYSAHITNIVQILRRADQDSLMLIDEIGAGTDPREGAALAISIIEEAIARGITLMATTHYGEIKNFAYTHEAIDVAGVAFNEETLSPGYSLEYGIPGASHAFSIASRLGLAPDILSRARGRVSEDVRMSEEMFRRIEEDLANARRKKLAADEEYAASAAARESYKRQIERLKNERQKLIEETRLAMRALIRQTKEESTRLLDELAAREHSPDARETANIRSRIYAMDQNLPSVPDDGGDMPDAREESDPAQGALAVGDTVEVIALKKSGIVSALKGDDVTVGIGSFTTQVTRAGVRRLGRGKKPSKFGNSLLKTSTPSPGMTLNIRGMYAEDAEEKLRKYLDDAGLAGLEMATIIHGKGTGVLRQLSQRVLAKHPFVVSYAPAHPAAGGDGATEVKFSRVAKS